MGERQLKRERGKMVKGNPYLIVIILVIIGGGIVLYSFLGSTPAVKFSCQNNSLVGFTKMSMPLMCVNCPTNCNVNMEIKDKDNDVICTGFSSDLDYVKVSCVGLKDHKGEQVNIIYSINSVNGVTNNSKSLTYNG